jgi:hypothetical protein
MTALGRPRRRRRSAGQALVEFALVIPIFLLVFMSVVEFTFLFTSFISVGYASHDAVQVAATYGNTAGADCAILERISNDIGIPANPAQVKAVDIYWVNTATPDASPVSGAENIYNYDNGGSHECIKPDGTKINVPYPISADRATEATSGGYPESQRCNVNAGTNCPLTGANRHDTVDTVAVKITYQYKWITPFPGMLGGSGNGPILTSINVMRLEPAL